MGDFFGGYTASALRSVLVLLMLAPVAFLYHKFEPIKWQANKRFLISMVVASFFVWGPLYYAILHAGIGLSLTINYATYVIGMFFFGWLISKDKISLDKIFSALLGIAGLVLVFAPSITSFGWFALGASVLSGFAISANIVFAKHLTYEATQSTLALWATSVIANGIMMFVVREKLPLIGWHPQYLYLVFFSIASIIASWALLKGLQFIEAGPASVLGLLEIVFSVLFGVIFFNERPGFIVVTGILVVIFAAAIPYFNGYNRQEKPNIVKGSE